MIKTSKQKEFVTNRRIEQLTEQVEELIGMVADRDAKIESLEAQLEWQQLLSSSEREGFKMANDIANQYLAKISDWAFADLIIKCQDAAFDAGREIVYLDDVISAVYAVATKYFQK